MNSSTLDQPPSEPESGILKKITKISGSLLFSKVLTAKRNNKTVYEQLHKSAILGDDRSFNRYYLSCHKGLTMFCVGMLKDLGLAENAASDALLKLVQNKQIKQIKNAKSWLFTIAKNQCLTYISKEKRRKEIRGTMNIANAQFPKGEQQMMAEQIDQIIQTSLTEREYNIWQLHQEGYNNEEIAQKLKSTAKTIANTKALIRKTLRTKLKALRHD